MAEAIAPLFEDHAEILGAIARVQKFIQDAYLPSDDTCNSDDWTMGCAGCQARMIDLQLDMLRRDVEDDQARVTPVTHRHR